LPLAAVTTIKEVTGRLSVPGRAQLIGANSPKRVMHAGWMGLGYHAQVLDGATVETVTWWKYFDFDTFDYTLPINLVFGDSLFTTCRMPRGELTCFGERMLIVRCANGVVAWLLSRTGPETATATCSQDGTVVPLSRVQTKHG